MGMLPMEKSQIRDSADFSQNVFDMFTQLKKREDLSSSLNSSETSKFA